MKSTPKTNHQQIKPEPLVMTTNYVVKDPLFTHHTQSWTSQSSQPSQQYSHRPSGYSSPHNNINSNYAASHTSSSYYNPEQSTHQHSPQSVSDIFNLSASDESIRPEDIFQIDQPIRSSSNNYADSSYSNSMSPSSVSRSPPATFTELESTSYTSNNFPYPSTYFNHQVSTTTTTKSSNWPIKFESFSESSLTSISQQFDENFLSIQQLQPTNGAATSDTNTASYYPNGDFFDHCEQVANVNGADQDPSQFYTTSGYDMDYEMMGQPHQHQAASTAGTSSVTNVNNNEWTTMDTNAYGNYGCNGLQSTNYLFDHFQQTQYLTA